MAAKASQANPARGAAGVALVAHYRPEGSQFVMWAGRVGGGLAYHYLDCANTSQERLEAHLAGFVDNHVAAWAKHQGAHA